jgi:predicted amidohydrolase
MEIRDGAAVANLERALEWIRGAPAADVYLLPELFSTGYAHDVWARSARDETPHLVAELTRVAGERSAAIGAGLISQGSAGLVNRFWLLREGARPTFYDKSHLFAPMGENRYLAPGQHRVRAPIGDWCAALSICFDLRFPEMYRLDAIAGADLFLVGAEWPAERAAAMRALAIARAIENQAYVALVNRAGQGADGTRFGGGSLLVAPDGTVSVELGSEPQVAVAVAEYEQVERMRGSQPHFALRRPGLDF